MGAHRLPNGQRAVRAVSFDEAEAIRARFDPLAPCGGPFWKVEKQNTPHPAATRDPHLKTLVLGTKRYALFNDGDRGELVIRKVSEHALGHLLPPYGWTTKDAMIEALWEAIIRFARGDKNAIEHLPFARLLAVGAHPISRPEHLRALRRAVPRRKGEPPKTLMPFGDMLIAYPRAPLGEAGSYDSQLQAAVREIPLSWLAETTGMSGRAIQYVRNGHVTPRPPQRGQLWIAVELWEVSHLKQEGEYR